MDIGRDNLACDPEEMKTYQVVPAEEIPTVELAKNQTIDEQPKVENVQETGVKVYRRRWIMLTIFVLVSMSNAFQWIQFAIITDVIMKYYNVDSDSVNWTSLVYMVAYIPLIFPGAWIMDKMGLRVTLLIGAFGTALGAWIKVLSVRPDLYYVAMIGQTVTAISQVFILGVPPNVAAVWFGPEQVSSACSIGVFGNQLGVALGFLLPPVIVKLHDNLDETGYELSIMFYMVAGVCSVLLLLVIFVFQSAPPTPPTSVRSQAEPLSYYSSVKGIISNKNYVLLLISYGINAGVFYAMSTLLNQTVLKHFSDAAGESAGQIGLTIVVCGMVGSVLCGIVLDRTHKFKETTLVVYLLAVCGMVAYTFGFLSGYIAIAFITAGLVGFFMTGYLPVGFEFAAELTYPEPEVTSSGLLNASAQIFGIIFTIMGNWLFTVDEKHGDLLCNGVLSVALLVGALITIFIKSDLRRLNANQVHKDATTGF